MYVTILDLVLILIIFVFVAFGFTMGLVQAIGSLVGIFLGTWVAGLYYVSFAELLTPIFLGNALTANIVSFILIFTVVNRLTGLAFWFVNKAFNLISIIPFTKSLNRILGAILGLVEGALAIGIVLYFIVHLPIPESFRGFVVDSQVAEFFIAQAAILVPLLPSALTLFTTWGYDALSTLDKTN